jgi:Spy/CpxP family protein refolding chaperone
MAQITFQTQTFDVPDRILEKYPNLTELITNTPSMTPEEKEYWFKILSIMNDEQVATLFQILDTEKQKLAALDKKYDQEVAKVNKPNAFDEAKAKEMREAMAKKEKMSEQEEAQAEAELLNELNNI